MLKKSTIIAMSRGKPSFWFIVLLFLFVLLVVFFFGGGVFGEGGYVKFCHNIYLWNIFWYILRTSWNIQRIIHFFFLFFYSHILFFLSLRIVDASNFSCLWFYTLFPSFKLLFSNYRRRNSTKKESTSYLFRSKVFLSVYLDSDVRICWVSFLSK